MNREILIDYLLTKLNTRAGSVLCAFVLICGGLYMCFAGLTATGFINLKAVLVEGHVETGSLGLISMFLGVVILLALNLHRPYDGQEIKVVVNGNEIIGKGLSFRKMRELVQVATVHASATPQGRTPKAHDDA